MPVFQQVMPYYFAYKKRDFFIVENISCFARQKKTLSIDRGFCLIKIIWEIFFYFFPQFQHLLSAHISLLFCTLFCFL